MCQDGEGTGAEVLLTWEGNAAVTERSASVAECLTSFCLLEVAFSDFGWGFFVCLLVFCWGGFLGEGLFLLNHTF